MAYGEAKVYSDGSHYIAIPHTEQNRRYRPKKVEEEITVVAGTDEGSETEQAPEPSEEPVSGENQTFEEDIETMNDGQETANEAPIQERKMTRKQLFEELYQKYIDLPIKERWYKVMDGMEAYFDSIEKLKWYVDLGFERKRRNLSCRRVRMVRKAYLAHFNYFVTLTYNDALHTEETFKKKLKTCLKNLCYRYGWKYMGVWERSPEKKRLHFHGLFYIPENTMPGPLIEVKDYSTIDHKMQVSLQCVYFNERFGRSDFEELNPRLLGESLAYLMKYMEKTGEKIVYSKGLAQYFISDITDDDVVCTIGQEDNKLLLYDDFKCWDEGTLIGTVSPEVIEQMRKTNK